MNKKMHLLYLICVQVILTNYTIIGALCGIILTFFLTQKFLQNIWNHSHVYLCPRLFWLTSICLCWFGLWMKCGIFIPFGLVFIPLSLVWSSDLIMESHVGLPATRFIAPTYIFSLPLLIPSILTL